MQVVKKGGRRGNILWPVIRREEMVGRRNSENMR